MTEKNIFAYKLFFVIKYISGVFLCENCNPPEKSHPIFPGNPPLKVEVLCYPRKFTVSTYIHQTLPNIKNVTDKHWHILSINENV